jgi:hypothetical protein
VWVAREDDTVQENRQMGIERRMGFLRCCQICAVGGASCGFGAANCWNWNLVQWVFLFLGRKFRTGKAYPTWFAGREHGEL